MDTRTRWTRADDRLLERGLGLALLLVGLFGVLVPALGVAGAVAPTDARAVTIEGPTRLPDSGADGAADGAVRLDGTRQAEITITDPDLGQRLLLALPEIAGGLVLALVLVLLLRMARGLRDGDVFAPENARRLIVIAVTVVVAGAFGPLLEAGTTALLLRGTPAADLVPFSYEFSFAYLLLAFLVAALAEVFRRGAGLRADTEGLV
ncbi:DUF2975 domain-containing protein [Streptomyces chumphonensis]|uniref:DUF2975 domain-containing protein n=1 Tax=Streptomyces chumphonensis TaxID=1214925 RepID=UPI003D744781